MISYDVSKPVLKFLAHSKPSISRADSIRMMSFHQVTKKDLEDLKAAGIQHLRIPIG